MTQIMSIEPFKKSPFGLEKVSHVEPVSASEPQASQGYWTVIANLADALKILESEGTPQTNGVAISAITQAMKALSDPFGIVPKHKSGGLAGWQCSALRKHIVENIRDRISISDLAETANLSTSHFCRAFRVSFDCSPSQFITQQRVERSRKMLLETNESLSQIAFDCGFSDQSHFSRIFHDLTGETPWRWRKERRDGQSVQ